MLNPRLARLSDYPFQRLRALLGDTPPGKPPLDLSLGEPQHAPPPLLAETLARSAAGWRSYPPIAGTGRWKTAVKGWLDARYGLPADMMGAASILPASGTREVLFMLGQLLLSGESSSRNGAPDLVLTPDPAYLPYVGAAVMNGATPLPVAAGPENGFLPDFLSLDAQTWARARVLYACSPANPQGTIMSLPQWTALIEKARAHDVTLVADECYSEIFDATRPPGALEACAALGGSLENVIVVNSLSKRSSCAGLRSGFVTGDPALMAAFARLRAYGAAGMPAPVQEASAALWSDETHVEENRARYRRKIDLAEAALKGTLGFRRPEGGFFLWLNVSGWGETGEQAALRLWREQGLRLLPGAYMSVRPAGSAVPAGTEGPDANAVSPYIRVALVHEENVLSQALARLRPPGDL